MEENTLSGGCANLQKPTYAFGMVNIDQWIRNLCACLLTDDVFTIHQIHKTNLVDTQAGKSSVSVPPDPIELCAGSEKGFLTVPVATLKALAGAFSTCGHCQCAGGCIH